MDAQAFIAKWNRAELSERSASQEHFIDLCRLVGVKTPAELDPTGDTFTFERPVTVTGPASKGSAGARGFVDAWYRGRFGWEYKRKGKYKDLDEAYQQLLRYREGLDNPPLLIVSDIARTVIRTNFTGYPTTTHEVALDDLATRAGLDTIRRVFTDPDSFKPDQTAAQVTEEAAKRIAAVAQGLRARGHDAHDAAHFLMKVMFCLFAEDVDLLPRGLFKDILTAARFEPDRIRRQMDTLFAAMREGGDFGTHRIDWFNGGLFDDAPALLCTEEEIAHLIAAAEQDWGAVEPAVFGTLFERSLDPNNRAALGAHYTSRDDIMLVVEPVIVRPLRREWDAAQQEIEAQLERRRTAKTPATKKKADDAILEALRGMLARLSSVRVLDPACGSGNFLYVAIQQLLTLEKEVIAYAARSDIAQTLISRVRPTQLRGIELNPYAAELAQVVIWIGYLQWMRDNGSNAPRDPILEPLQTIENRDAILAWEDEHGQPIPAWREGAICRGQADWPEADFIVGNPPFLGTKLLRRGLGDAYVEALFTEFMGRIPNFSDLCCYWFEIARHIASQRTAPTRVGLLATQGIRGKESRKVLEAISTIAVIFDAHADREWLLDGAAVHVSIVCFATGDAPEATRLDGLPVPLINADLTAGAAVGTARRLKQNEDIGFVGDVKSGSFDIDWQSAREWLRMPNPAGLSPALVLLPWTNGLDLTRRPRSVWIIDFGTNEMHWSSGFGDVFEHVRREVKPARDKVKRKKYRDNWWIHAEPCMEMRRAIARAPRFLATAVLTKHRLFGWMESSTLPDHQLIVFARSDDYFFGTLHSSIHELWALRQGTQLEDRPRYTPTTCFETFPLPWPPGEEPGEQDAERPLHDAIAEAARLLNEQRERWLNPPEWVAEIAARIDARDDFADVARVSGEEARRLIRQSAIDAEAAQDARLKKRTLTNLYNERPTWLRLAHERLDRAVLAAYAAVDPAGAWSPDWAEVFTETGAGQPLPEQDGSPHPLASRRAEVEQSILANLLRLNLERARR